MVMQDMRRLFGRVTFEDLTEDSVKEMCEIIVKGKQTDYMFYPNHESPGGYDVLGPNQKYLGYINFTETTEELLVRSGLIERYKEARKHDITLRPTQKAIQFYERLKHEGLLDESGYLKLKLHQQ